MQPTDARDEMAEEGRKEGLGWAGCAQIEMSYRNTGLVSSLLCFPRIKSRDPSPHLALHFKKTPCIRTSSTYIARLFFVLST